MPRRKSRSGPTQPEAARVAKQVLLRLAPKDIERLDRLRGGMSRSAFVNSVLRKKAMTNDAVIDLVHAAGLALEWTAREAPHPLDADECYPWWRALQAAQRAVLEQRAATPHGWLGHNGEKS